MRKQISKGFSLIEVLVIVAVVSVGLIPVLSLISHTARRVSFNEEMVTANLWSVQLIERYRLTPLWELKDKFSSPVDVRALLGSDELLKDLWENQWMDDKSRKFFKRYTVTLQFISDPAIPDAMGKLLSTVSWKDKAGKERTEERFILIENLVD